MSSIRYARLVVFSLVPSALGLLGCSSHYESKAQSGSQPPVQLFAHPIENRATGLEWVALGGLLIDCKDQIRVGAQLRSLSADGGTFRAMEGPRAALQSRPVCVKFDGLEICVADYARLLLTAQGRKWVNELLNGLPVADGVPISSARFRITMPVSVESVAGATPLAGTTPLPAPQVRRAMSYAPTILVGEPGSSQFRLVAHNLPSPIVASSAVTVDPPLHLTVYRFPWPDERLPINQAPTGSPPYVTAQPETLLVSQVVVLACSSSVSKPNAPDSKVGIVLFRDRRTGGWWRSPLVPCQ